MTTLRLHVCLLSCFVEVVFHTERIKRQQMASYIDSAEKKPFHFSTPKVQSILNSHRTFLIITLIDYIYISACGSQRQLGVP